MMSIHGSTAIIFLAALRTGSGREFLLSHFPKNPKNNSLDFQA